MQNKTTNKLILGFAVALMSFGGHTAFASSPSNPFTLNANSGSFTLPANYTGGTPTNYSTQYSNTNTYGSTHNQNYPNGNGVSNTNNNGYSSGNTTGNNSNTYYGNGNNNGYGYANTNGQTLSVPQVVTKNPASVNQSSAILTAFISSQSSSTIYFEYGDTPSLGRETNRMYLGAMNDDVTMNIDGLNPASTYYFRVIAENTAGRTYGNIVTFSTKNIIVAPVTYSNSNTVSTATVKGTVGTTAGSTATNTNTTTSTEVKGNSVVAPSVQNESTVDGTNLTALSLFGDGRFLPSTIFEWFIVFLLLFIVIVLIRQFYKKSHHDAHHAPAH